VEEEVRDQQLNVLLLIVNIKIMNHNIIFRGLFKGLLVICAALSLTGCDIKKSKADPSDSFSAVYDHPDVNLSFYPVDMVQTHDGGFLVLSVYTDTALSTFPLIRLMKTDKTGALVREQVVDAAYCSAVPALIPNGSSWRFLCMDAVNQNTKLMEVDDALTSVSKLDDLAGKYPLYLFADNSDNFLVLSFDRIARTSVLTLYTSSGEQEWQSSYNINEDYKNQIETHLKKAGRQFPFFILQSGESTASHYLVNCFFNYTMTLIFANPATGGRDGQVNTYQDNAAISSAAYLDGSRFALSRYYMSENYIFPSVELDQNNTQGSDDFNDIHLSELTADAAVKSITTTFHNKEVVVYASQTKTNSLVLYFFNKADGKLVATKNLASTNPVNIAGLISTSDGGLALLAQTYVAGRFPRIAIFKIAPGDIPID
jgi:hypothetical protein